MSIYPLIHLFIYWSIDLSIGILSDNEHVYTQRCHHLISSSFHILEVPGDIAALTCRSRSSLEPVVLISTLDCADAMIRGLLWMGSMKTGSGCHDLCSKTTWLSDVIDVSAKTCIDVKNNIRMIYVHIKIYVNINAYKWM